MKTKKLLSLILAFMVVLSSVTLLGCSGYKRKTLNYGLGDVSYELQPLLEPCCTSDYLSDVCGGFGVNTFRIWMSNSDMFLRETDSDEITLNPLRTKIIHELCARMKDNGVTRLCAMSTTFIFPFDYTPTTYSVAPDPVGEAEFYQRYLNLIEKCYAMLAEEFDEIDYFEAINEPDINTHGVIHKNGYTFNGSAEINSNYIYTEEETARICMDIQYYATKGVKSVDENKKVLSPALCAYTASQDFLDLCYEAIESETLPTGSEYAITDPDCYFEILNWHPYILSLGAKDMSEEWIQFQRDMYQVALDHGDKGTPVWFTEIGFSYSGIGEEEAVRRLNKMFEHVKKLDFIDTVIVFRITDLYVQNISDLENNFGMLRSVCDPSVTVDNVVKEIGKAYFKEINGDVSITKLTDKIEKYINIY